MIRTWPIAGRPFYRMSRNLASVLPLVPAMLLGCSELQPSHPRQEVYQHWDSVRGRLKYQLASDRFKTGQIDQAYEQLKEALQLDPTASASYILLTKIMIERGELASAATAIQTAIERGGEDAEIDFLQGMIAQRYGRQHQALRWYAIAFERQPDNAHYLAAEAEMLVSTGRLDEALALVKQHWTDFEQNATLRSLAGAIHMMLGQYEQAADAYREAARIAPDDPMLACDLGAALTRSGRHKEACDALTRAAQGRELPANALIDLGRCHLALNQPADAKQVLRQATTVAPENAQTWSWLARAALAAEDLLTARQAAAKAHEIDQEGIDHAILLGYICCRQGDDAGARFAFQDALRREPEDILARKLLDRLDRGDRLTSSNEDPARFADMAQLTSTENAVNASVLPAASDSDAPLRSWEQPTSNEPQAGRRARSP